MVASSSELLDMKLPSFGSLFKGLFSLRPPAPRLSYDQLSAERDRLSEENGQLKAELERLSQRSSGVRPARTEPAIPTLGQAPDYPKETSTVVADMPKAAGWAHLKASVLGSGKEMLQDAHAVVTYGSSAVLIVCDGAGSKKHSKDGADLAAKFLKEKFEVILAAGQPIKTDEWVKLSHDLLLEAAVKLDQHALTVGKPLQEFGATCIIAFANDEFAACSHVGDGRAGYLDAKGVWRSLMVPYKGAEANATIFLSMLKADNAAGFIRHQVVPGRTRAIVALSDGPENVCWHVSTKDFGGGEKLIDPNVPSAKFFGQIANQLAGASAQKVPQVELDGFWAKFLTSGNEQLANEIDDKTLLLALRG
jgi:hypothetical protein